jgi:flagella basal body P-ring formation protein FlgA
VSVDKLSEPIIKRGDLRSKKRLSQAGDSSGQAGKYPLPTFWRHGMAAICWLLSSGVYAADPLDSQLTAFMQRQFTTHPVSITVTVKTPASQRLKCDQPQFSLPSRNRIWGNISIAMVCGAQKRYLQAEVAVTDRYLIAARPITGSQTLTADDIAWQTGRLDLLSSLPLTDKLWATGSVAGRAIGSGQPLTAAMLRRPWLVKIGQQVKMSAQGVGFAIQSSGKAMNNAAVNDTLQVRMDSGQIVNGQVMPDGSLHVML